MILDKNNDVFIIWLILAIIATSLLPQKISESLEPVDGTLSAQVELLKEALESGIDFNQKDNDEVLSDTSSISELEVGEKGKDKENLLTDEMMMEEDSHNRQLRVNKGKQHKQNINNNSKATSVIVACLIDRATDTDTHTLILFFVVTANADMDKEENFLERGALENTMRNSIAAARKRESEVVGYCGSTPNIASQHVGHQLICF